MACQVCLQIINNKKPIFYINDIYFNDVSWDALTIKEKLADCVPELLLDSVPNAILCKPCANVLMTAYGFRQRCLETQQKIYGYLQQMPIGTPINIPEIAAHYNRLKIVAQGGNPHQEDDKMQIFSSSAIKDGTSSKSSTLVDNIQTAVLPKLECVELVTSTDIANSSTSGDARAPFLPKTEIEQPSFPANTSCTLKSTMSADDVTASVPTVYKSHKPTVHKINKKSLNSYNAFKASLLQPLVKPSTFADDVALSIPRFSENSKPPVSATTTNSYDSMHASDLNIMDPNDKRLSFPCQMCPMSFSEELDLQDHFVVTHQNPLLTCHACQFVTRMPYIMRRHKRSHKIRKNPKQFACNFCKYRGKHESAIEQHTKDKHKVGLADFGRYNPY